MPRNMSFAITTPQFKNKTKNVTRRNGWLFLKAGDVVCGVKKAMGLKKGEKIERLGLIKILSVKREPLKNIDQADCDCEGFPKMTPHDFVNMYCKHNKCDPDKIISRIKYDYI